MPELLRIMLLSLRQMDPLLHDGAGRTLLARLRALQHLECQVSISNFLPNSTRNQQIIKRMNLAEITHKHSSNSSYSHVPLLGVDAYHELLPFGWDEITNGYPQILAILINHLKKKHPDFIITVGDGFLPLLAACLVEIPGAHSFHSLANIKFVESRPEFIRLIKHRLVICNSKFAKTEIQNRLDTDAYIWHSHINFQDLRGKEEEYQMLSNKPYDIGFSSGHPVKGGALVAKIAKRMPERSFLIVGNYCSEALKQQENVSFLGFITGMACFYSQIKVMLVPSFVLESYPRVVLEASAFGLPVIANRMGGIPEALGDSGILVDIDFEDPLGLDYAADQYVSHIRNLMEKPALYKRYQKKALFRVKKHVIDQTWEAYKVYEKLIKPRISLNGIS